jgi:type III secretory pathway component EscV
MSTELINISIGELWDKYTILLIKQEKVKNLEKLEKVHTEINFLDKNMSRYDYINNELFKKLKEINIKLWNIEDKLRIKELNKEFDEEFITLARSVYVTNDMRGEYKNKINDFFGSTIYEVKDYVNYKND